MDADLLRQLQRRRQRNGEAESPSEELPGGAQWVRASSDTDGREFAKPVLRFGQGVSAQAASGLMDSDLLQKLQRQRKLNGEVPESPKRDRTTRRAPAAGGEGEALAPSGGGFSGATASARSASDPAIRTSSGHVAVASELLERLDRQRRRVDSGSQVWENSGAASSARAAAKEEDSRQPLGWQSRPPALKASRPSSLGSIVAAYERCASPAHLTSQVAEVVAPDLLQKLQRQRQKCGESGAAATLDAPARSSLGQDFKVRVRERALKFQQPGGREQPQPQQPPQLQPQPQTPPQAQSPPQLLPPQEQQPQQQPQQRSHSGAGSGSSHRSPVADPADRNAGLDEANDSGSDRSIPAAAADDPAILSANLGVNMCGSGSGHSSPMATPTGRLTPSSEVHTLSDGRGSGHGSPVADPSGRCTPIADPDELAGGSSSSSHGSPATNASCWRSPRSQLDVTADGGGGGNDCCSPGTDWVTWLTPRADVDTPRAGLPSAPSRTSDGAAPSLAPELPLGAPPLADNGLCKVVGAPDQQAGSKLGSVATPCRAGSRPTSEASSSSTSDTSGEEEQPLETQILTPLRAWRAPSASPRTDEDGAAVASPVWRFSMDLADNKAKAAEPIPVFADVDDCSPDREGAGSWEYDLLDYFELLPLELTSKLKSNQEQHDELVRKLRRRSKQLQAKARGRSSLAQQRQQDPGEHEEDDETEQEAQPSEAAAPSLQAHVPPALALWRRELRKRLEHRAEVAHEGCLRLAAEAMEAAARARLEHARRASEERLAGMARRAELEEEELRKREAAVASERARCRRNLEGALRELGQSRQRMEREEKESQAAEHRCQESEGSAQTRREEADALRVELRELQARFTAGRVAVARVAALRRELEQVREALGSAPVPAHS